MVYMLETKEKPSNFCQNYTDKSGNHFPFRFASAIYSLLFCRKNISANSKDLLIIK